ncbi:hypothetical protein B6V74_14795 [Thioclava sp. F42-5]|nr:hypothetical protein B6V74_14795 [Thioclava sp. F42-5]
MGEETEQAKADLIAFVLDSDWNFSFQIALMPAVIIGIVLVLMIVVVRRMAHRRMSDFEIDSAEMGFGDAKFTFKPNDTDRQIAYSIWVELSTRKVGLPIDPDDDVISEIYDSWYSFFSVTRELIKDIPVSKVRGDSTSKIVDLSVEVLNEGLRPHLTKWQARFRHWYEHQSEDLADIDPQALQKKFPLYDDLMEDLLAVNVRLIAYRKKMNELVRG